MKFAFFASNIVPIHAHTLRERALGGTETGVIRLAEALDRLGHDVTVFTPHENPPESKPKYLPLKAIEAAEKVDIFVTIRDWIPLFYKIPARKRFLWTGDSYDQFMNYGIGDRRVSGVMDALLTVSEWQADQLSEKSGFPREKCWKLGNGLELDFFKGSESKGRKRLLYSSTPHRGLRHIPRLFAELKKKHPEAECHIFSSLKIYDQDSDPQAEKTLAELKQQPDVTIHGSVKQEQLAREFMKSSVLFYPCEFEETSCITAMEAMASGCVVLSSKLGALPETVGDAGVLVKGLPGTADYDSAFLAAADRLLSDEVYYQGFAKRGRSKAESLSWQSIAERFISFIDRLA